MSFSPEGGTFRETCYLWETLRNIGPCFGNPDSNVSCDLRLEIFNLKWCTVREKKTISVFLIGLFLFKEIQTNCSYIEATYGRLTILLRRSSYINYTCIPDQSESKLQKLSKNSCILFLKKCKKNGTVLACSRCLDIGVQREGREREKNKEERGGDWGERGLSLIPTPPLVVFFLLTSLYVVSWNRLVPCVRGFIWTITLKTHWNGHEKL